MTVPFTLDADTKSTFLGLSREELKLRLEVTDQFSKVQKISRDISRIKKDLGFREKYLGGHLWGKVGFLKKYKSLETDILEEASRFQTYTNNHLIAESKLHSAINTYLDTHLDGYVSLREGLEHITRTISVLDDYIHVVDEASYQVNKSWGQSPKVSVISLDDVVPEKTKESIQDVVKKTEKYNRSLLTYNTFVAERPSPLFRFKFLDHDFTKVHTLILDGSVQKHSLYSNLSSLSTLLSVTLYQLKEEKIDAYVLKKSYSDSLLAQAKQ